MQIINRGQVSTADIIAPELLYKYRNFENANHLGIITKREIYFAEPTSFEDKFDCKIPVRYDLLTEDEIYSKYLHESRIQHPNWTAAQQEKWAKDWTDKSPIKDKQNLKDMTEHFFQEYNSRIGILSLTANSGSVEMWKKYSSDQSGFCVGFNAKLLFEHLGGGGPVEYDFDELPIIWPTPKHSFEEQRQLQVFSKLRKWSFEEEYRTIIFDKDKLDGDKRKRTLPVEVYNQIILGTNISKENEHLILDALSKEMNHIKIVKQTDLK